MTRKNEPKSATPSKATAPADGGSNQGEGNRDAARRYDASAKAFADSGKVQEAAKAAKPNDKAEARALEDAEREGRSHAKDEDPTVPGANEAHRRDKR